MGLLARGGGEEDEERGEFSIAGMDQLDGGAPTETEYVLDEWSEDDRVVLRERLETLGVPHRWEGPALVVAAADEAWTERVMDQVEADLDDARAQEAAGTVGYDLTEWDDDSCKKLMDLLEVDAIPYQLDGDELFVDGADEDRVDELITAVLDPDAVVPAAEGGFDVMSELFVATDVLSHDPDDRAGTRSLLAATQQAVVQGPPYGMEPVWWDGVVKQAQGLAATLGADPLDPEVVVEQATVLRDHLRPFI